MHSSCWSQTNYNSESCKGYFDKRTNSHFGMGWPQQSLRFAHTLDQGKLLNAHTSRVKNWKRFETFCPWNAHECAKWYQRFIHVLRTSSAPCSNWNIKFLMGQAFQLQILQNPKQIAIISDAWCLISLNTLSICEYTQCFCLSSLD